VNTHAVALNRSEGRGTFTCPGTVSVPQVHAARPLVRHVPPPPLLLRLIDRQTLGLQDGVHPVVGHVHPVPPFFDVESKI
jgi:hypothetical protein